MISSPRSLRAVFAVLLALTLSIPSLAQVNHLIISQLYGGGGNGGSVYNNDFVELYNPTGTPVDLSTYSLQYTSTAGTFSAGNTLQLVGTVQPGQYFLIKLAAGANSPQALPTPDFDPTVAPYNTPPYNVLALSATGGKIALVQGTTPLSSGCPSAAAYVDFVGWGTANCSYGDATGATKAAATANPTGLSLNSANSWTGVNSTDYTVVTPHPRNSTGSTPSTVLTVTGTSFTPASITQGNSTTLSVVVSPGTATSNIQVTANLSALGGSATQALTLGAANTYSYTYAVPVNTTPNTYPVTATVTSSDPTVTGSANLTVTAVLVTTPIATIQANRGTYVGTTIQTQGVITVITSSGYYLQTSSTTPGSSGDEGLYVYTGSAAKPAAVAVGNLVTVTGALTQFPAPAVSHTPSLEVTGASVTGNGTAAIPAAITLPTGFPTAGGGIAQFARYESMLVRVPSLTAVSPTDGYLTETTETVTSSGQFYAVSTGVARPFREPGMDFRDYPSSTCPSLTNCASTATAAGVARPSAVVLYDDNPERFIVESSLGGGTPLDVSSGAVLTNVTGVVDFSYATDVPYGDPARIILQPGQVTSGNYTPGVTVQPLAVPGANQVTVAAFNIERFFNPSAADNKYFNAGTGNVGNSSAVNVTADAYARRLAKLSLAIRNVLNTPDVLGLEEVENVSVLRDIAAKIDTDAVAAGKPAPGYVAYGTDSTTTYTDDVGGISVGFLVKPSTVNVLRWEQIGAQTTFAASTGTQTLNDRPSQVLHVGFKRAGGTDYAMTLIVNHLRSLSGIGTSADTRLKKELQAEAIANAIQGYQAAGERVLAFGDLNAFEFSDGYTDTLGTFTGRVSPTGTAAQPGTAIVNPVATDLVTLLPAADRRSYVEFGNAQVLDHMVATANVVGSTQLAYAHLNSDFPLTLTNDVTTPARTSDHDAAVAYLAVPAPVVSATLTGSGTFATTVTVGSTSAGQQFVLTNTGETPLTITGIATTGDFSQTNTCGSSLAAGSTCPINVVFRPTVNGARTGTLTVSSNATIAPATLSGTGYVPPTFAFGPASGTSTSITVPRGTAAQLTLTLTPTTTFSGTINLSCTGLPSNSSCDFGSAGTLNLAAGSSPQTITLLIRTSTLTAGLNRPPAALQPEAASRIALAFALPGMLLAGMGARRRLLHGSRLMLLGLMLVSLAGTLGLFGCSSHSVPNTTTTPAAAGTYTVNVVAASASASQTLPITLTIQ